MPRSNAADTITISWHIDDVQELRPDLSDDECREVLRVAEHDYDASMGITWEILEIHADNLYPLADDLCPEPSED